MTFETSIAIFVVAAAWFMFKMFQHLGGPENNKYEHIRLLVLLSGMWIVIYGLQIANSIAVNNLGAGNVVIGQVNFALSILLFIGGVVTILFVIEYIRALFEWFIVIIKGKSEDDDFEQFNVGGK